MKKVSAATITQLTARAATAPLPLSSGDTVAPSVEDLLEDLQRKSPDRATELARLLVNLPAGFALAPVLYTRIDSATRASVESEYVFSVRERFLKFLAETQAEGLRRLGICDHGIARMARGLDPANADGQRYHVNVDHIIERAGSGRLSDARRRDPQRRDGAESYPVNHFGNLILMPEGVHDYKNRLNAVQGVGHVRDGESCWVLMMVPVRDQLHHGYVCPPQPQGGKTALKALRPTPSHQIGEIATLSGRAGELMGLLRDGTVAGDTLALLEKLARRKRPANGNQHLKVVGSDGRPKPPPPLDLLRHPFTVSDLARENANGLSQIFNTAMSHDTAAQQRITRELRPNLEEIRQLMVATYARVAELRAANGSHPFYNDFRQFFQGGRFRGLVLAAAAFPLPESQALLDDYRRIDKALRCGQSPKPLKPIKKAA